MDETDKLDRILRRGGQARVDDDGFSARVMAALPPRALALRPWLARVLVLGSTALGSALAWFFAPGGIDAAQGFVDLASRSLTPAAIATLALGGALLVSALVLVADTE
jgi:hypothetical protein